MKKFARLAAIAVVAGASLAPLGAAAAVSSQAEREEALAKLSTQDRVPFETRRLEAIREDKAMPPTQVREELTRAQQVIDQAQKELNERRAAWSREKRLAKGVELAGFGLLIFGLMAAFGASAPAARRDEDDSEHVGEIKNSAESQAPAQKRTPRA